YPYTGHFGKLSEKDKEAVQSAIDLVEIGNLTECDFSAISDGQRQRVMLARAICQEPKILILDEPTSYLDIHYKIMFLETVRRLADEKDIAVIMTMHELDFAEKISDYTVCVKNGEITHSGKPCDVFKDDVISELFDIPDELYNKYLLS
ncbi:MAG: ABC transporter ATP-binding protein, partial [Clostridia bacterium]|nr:ABC transporter ATP-binding protein [Clostridia bacterium]